MKDSNFHRIFTQLLSSLRPHVLAVSVACIGLILIGYGMITSFMPKEKTADISFEHETSSVKKNDQSVQKTGNIAVDVSGSVKKPGVYRLFENARIEDALLAAGGFSTDADFDWTQHSLNLAAKVTDGMKIYIPHQGEEIQSDKVNKDSEGSIGVVGASAMGLISINNGSSAELESLPGIGPVTAAKIMDHRPYASLDELVSKKAVGNATFEKIKELVSL